MTYVCVYCNAPVPNGVDPRAFFCTCCQDMAETVPVVQLKDEDAALFEEPTL